MAYDRDNPPSLITQGIGGTEGLRFFAHMWVDPIATVLTPGYITDADFLGMRPGDSYAYKDTNRGEWDVYHLIVDSVAADGSATLKFPEVPEEAMEAVADPGVATVQAVVYIGGRQVRVPIEVLDYFGVATEADMKAATDNTLRTTPLRVRQAVDYWAHINFNTVADLLADTSMAYSTGNRQVAAGQIVEAEGYRYQVAASSASDHHVTTSGGVKMYVKPNSSGGFALAAFGITGNNTALDQSAAIHAAFTAVGSGLVIAPEGTIRCNIVVPNNIILAGSGRHKTVFMAASAATAIIELGDATLLESYYLEARSFRVDGEGTAAEGIRVGRSASSRTATYAKLADIEVRNCLNDNIHLQNAVGFEVDQVYSYGAGASALLIDTNDIVTTVKVKRSAFRQSLTGVRLRGGAILDFDTVVIESNKNIGLFFSRITVSGARQSTFRTVWMENNGHTPSGSESALAGSMYIDMVSTGPANDWPLYLSFYNCVVNCAPGRYDVYLNRGDEVLFDHCVFRELTSTTFFAQTGVGYAYATLIECGTYDKRPSPTLYASFPALVNSGTKRLGFKYQYTFEGVKYDNYSYKATATWDPASIATGAQASTTVAVGGAAIGMAVQVTSSIALSGLRLWGEVTAAGTVTVYLSNNTGGAVDLGSMTLTVKVLPVT